MSNLCPYLALSSLISFLNSFDELGRLRFVFYYAFVQMQFYFRDAVCYARFDSDVKRSISFSSGVASATAKQIDEMKLFTFHLRSAIVLSLTFNWMNSSKCVLN